MPQKGSAQGEGDALDDLSGDLFDEDTNRSSSGPVKAKIGLVKSLLAIGILAVVVFVMWLMTGIRRS